MRWNLPSAGKNPKFKAFADAPQPVRYRMFRAMGSDIMGGKTANPELYTVAEAEYADDCKLQLWVSEVNGNSWTLIV